MSSANKLVSHTSIYMLGDVLRYSVSLVMLPIYTRYLTPEDYGVVELLSMLIDFSGHCNDIARILREIDMLLITPDHEGFPMILLEAMALQTPVIAHAVGGIPILLDQGACGVLVRDHNAAGYGNEIYKLAHNQKMFLDMSAESTGPCKYALLS